MTTNVQVVGPEQSLQTAAQFMAQLNVGDITIRGTAAGLAPGAACVSDVMTERTVWCSQA